MRKVLDCEEGGRESRGKDINFRRLVRLGSSFDAVKKTREIEQVSVNLIGN